MGLFQADLLGGPIPQLRRQCRNSRGISDREESKRVHDRRVSTVPSSLSMYIFVPAVPNSHTRTQFYS